MSDEKQHFLFYMCFETDEENGTWRSLTIRSSLDEVGEWKKANRNVDSRTSESSPDVEDLEVNEPEEEEEAHAKDSSIELSKLMSRFQETMSSYRPLVGVSMILMPTLRSHFIENEMYKNADKQLEIVDEDPPFKTYGITEDQYPSVQTQFRRLREFDRGVTVLPGAILLSLVATFDSFIADTLRIMLRHKPERVIESAKTISVKEVLNMSSFDDVIGKITENEVEAIMRGSHDDQIQYIENKLDISIRPHYDEWGEFMEIFERRNLIAHGNYIINSHYITGTG